MRNPFAFRLTLIILAVLGLLFGFAVAEGAIALPPLPDLDLKAWAAESAALGAVVVFLVAVCRKWVWNADGPLVPLLSVALGLVLALVLHFTGFIDTVAGAIAHGFAAGVFAFGGVDALRGIFKVDKDVPNALQNTVDTAASRLRVR